MFKSFIKYINHIVFILIKIPSFFHSNIKSKERYSVISAVYNVEDYLDDYFKSLINQSLDFHEHIQLIIVDDGSTDNSAEIINMWKKKYPKNIIYIKKKNAGQASARNLGLNSVKTPWVTFIDPDDFVDSRYFESVDEQINKDEMSKLAMIGCNLYYYFENYGLYLNRHPLRYCFDDNTLLPIRDLKNKMQLSASTAFFRIDLINRIHLRFDEKIKPNFEDAHFVNSYLIANNQLTVTFLKAAKYYYRRREIKNSTSDNAWEKKELFNEVLLFGCLNLFEQADETLGYIPKYLQRTILYHLSWYYKYLVDHNEKISFLSNTEQKKFHNLVQKIFNYIDIDTIEEFNLVGIGFFEKAAWIHLYKKVLLPYQTIFVKKDKKQLYFNYYAYTPTNLYIEVNAKEIKIPKLFQKEHIFVNKRFITEYSFEIPILKHTDIISIQIDSVKTYINSSGEKFSNGISINQIKTLTIPSIRNVIHNLGRKLLLG